VNLFCFADSYRFRRPQRGWRLVSSDGPRVGSPAGRVGGVVGVVDPTVLGSAPESGEAEPRRKRREQRRCAHDPCHVVRHRLPSHQCLDFREAARRHLSPTPPAEPGIVPFDPARALAIHRPTLLRPHLRYHSRCPEHSAVPHTPIIGVHPQFHFFEAETPPAEPRTPSTSHGGTTNPRRYDGTA